MEIIGGLFRPNEGRLYLSGELISINSVSDSSRLGIAFIHQELHVLDNIDVAGNVFLGREPLHAGPLRLIDRRKINSRASILLKRAGLRVPPTTLLSSLSIGQRQLVEIAKALSMNAKILIMDEPTSSLTFSETERLLNVVRELKKQRVSIIYISHRLGEVNKIADRVVVLRDGKISGELDKNALNTGTMMKLMVGRDIKDFYFTQKHHLQNHSLN